MKRVKAFWVIISVLTALLAVVIVADPALAQCGSCPANQQGPVTDTMTVNVAAGETCEFTAHGAATNPIAAFIGANVTVPGHGTASSQADDGCFDNCGGNVSCILSCQSACTRFSVETDAVLEVTFDASGVYTASASATGTCNPSVQLAAQCDGDDAVYCMMPMDGDMNDTGYWTDVGDIRWQTASGDGYAVIDPGDWIQQVIPMTYTTQTYWNYYANPAVGYTGDEVQIQVTHYGLTTTPYSVTVELPSSGFISLPLTGSVGIKLTGVSSPTHLSYFCLGYGDACQFPDSELTNMNYNWAPEERFGTMGGGYESYGGAWLDPDELFYQITANDYATQGDYAFTAHGTVSSSDPITIGVDLESCGLGVADQVSRFVVTPVSNTWWITENVYCDGYNRLQIRNFSDDTIFVDRVCLEEQAVCQLAGECYVSNPDLSTDLVYGGIEDWNMDAVNTVLTISDTNYYAKMQPTGWISQNVCLEPGDYEIQVWAMGITNTGETGDIVMGVNLDMLAGDVDVPLGRNPYGTIYPFNYYEVEATVAAMGWHEFSIEHQGGAHTLAVDKVCFVKKGYYETPEIGRCGYIINSEFADVLHDGRTPPWYTGFGEVEFANGIATIKEGSALNQLLSSPYHETECCGYTDYNNFYECEQCTWWGNYTRHDLNFFGADAYMWYTRTLGAGYTVTDTPTSGAVAVFQPGVAGADATFGHVAYVESESGSSFDVSHMGWGGDCVANDTFTTQNGIDFIYPYTGTNLTYTLRIIAKSTNWAPAELNVLIASGDGTYSQRQTIEIRNASRDNGWETLTETFNLPADEDLYMIQLEARGDDVALKHVCLWMGREEDWPGDWDNPPPDQITDTTPITEELDCAFCDVPAPLGCDPWQTVVTATDYCSIRRGQPYWQGGSSFWDTVTSSVRRLGYLLGWAFEWGWCKLGCWFALLIEAIRDQVTNVANADIPVLSDLACIALQLPRLISNELYVIRGNLFFWLPAFVEWWAATLNWLQAGVLSMYVEELESLFFNLGDLLVAIIDMLLLLIILPVEFVGLIVHILVAVIAAFTSTSEESMILPAAGNLFWCAADIIERVITNTPLQWIPAMYFAKLTIDNLWWAIKKFSSLGGEDY